MKNRTIFFTLPAMALALGAVPLSGCSYLKAHEAHVAYSEYQDALASGNMLRARNALLRLVRADQDVADYWTELGKLQLQLGAYREAYDAFAHAHELDRSNVQVLATMTQLALLSRDQNLANEQAKTLALLAPDNPAVTLVRGFAALKAGDLDKAQAGADALLASTPDDSFANILKARVLIAQGKVDDAVSLLENQHRTVPQDRGAIRALAALYQARGDWRNVARIQLDLHRLDPRDSRIALAAVDAFLHAGNVEAARQLSLPFLAPSANPQLVEQTLDLWARRTPERIMLPDQAKLGAALSGDARVSFAEYLNQAGEPAAAAALLGGPQLPVTHVNARLNAVVAHAMALQHQTTPAKRLFDLVLEREPDQVEALRGRSTLDAQTGATKQAVIDAQRLVTINPDSAPDRLLLAHAFLAAHNGAAVRRTLWQAFQDLPDDDRIYSALNSVLVSTGDSDGQRRLADEYADNRQAKLTKDLI